MWLAELRNKGGRPGAGNRGSIRIFLCKYTLRPMSCRSITANALAVPQLKLPERVATQRRGARTPLTRRVHGPLPLHDADGADAARAGAG